MKTLTIVLAVMLATSSADVSHLANHYMSAKHDYYKPISHLNTLEDHYNHPASHFSQTSNQHVQTTIVKHDVLELPTQIEIIKEGHSVYGIRPQAIINAKLRNEIRSHNFPPTQEIENLQPPQIPYEMSIRTYLPPLPIDTTTTTSTTDMPTTTTTMMPPTTTDMPEMVETTTTGTEFPMSTTEEDMMPYDSTTSTNEMPTTETTYETTTSFPTPRESKTMSDTTHFLHPPPSMEPQNQYLPPSPVMLPPVESMTQATYQQFQEQMMREHQQTQQQMYRENEMQEMIQAFAKLNQRQMIALNGQQNLQLQPVVPVEPAHILHDDGYHYRYGR